MIYSFDTVLENYWKWKKEKVVVVCSCSGSSLVLTLNVSLLSSSSAGGLTSVRQTQMCSAEAVLWLQESCRETGLPS